MPRDTFTSPATKPPAETNYGIRLLNRAEGFLLGIKLRRIHRKIGRTSFRALESLSFNVIGAEGRSNQDFCLNTASPIGNSEHITEEGSIRCTAGARGRFRPTFVVTAKRAGDIGVGTTYHYPPSPEVSTPVPDVVIDFVDAVSYRLSRASDVAAITTVPNHKTGS